MKISGNYCRRATVRCSEDIRTFESTRGQVIQYTFQVFIYYIYVCILNIPEKVTCELYPVLITEELGKVAWRLEAVQLQWEEAVFFKTELLDI